MLKIILPTDFSANAFNAAVYAKQLFAGQKVRFYLVNTYTPAVYHAEYVLHSPGLVGLGDDYQLRSQERLELVREQLESRFPNTEHELYTHAAFNTVVDEVVEFSKQEEADLIIMGTQGATGAQEILLGTHTMHVLRRASCPVMAIPSGYGYQTPESILFPTDLEVALTPEHLNVLLEIARAQLAKVAILHVSSGYELDEKKRENKRQLERTLGEVGCEFHDLPNQEIISAINNFQGKPHVNLLCMVRNTHTFIERLFIEPVIKKIVFHVTIPFLVLPPVQKSS